MAEPYLYYFYYAEEAIAGVDHDGVTRGEEIRDLTARLVADLKAIDPERDPDAAAKRFRAYHRRRGATYMALAREARRPPRKPIATRSTTNRGPRPTRKAMRR